MMTLVDRRSSFISGGKIAGLAENSKLNSAVTSSGSYFFAARFNLFQFGTNTAVLYWSIWGSSKEQSLFYSYGTVTLFLHLVPDFLHLSLHSPPIDILVWHHDDDLISFILSRVHVPRTRN